MNRKIALNGREYTLRYTVNAVCCLEEKMGAGLESLMRTQLSCLRGLLWCGLMENHPGVTLERAGEMLQAHLEQGGSLRAVADILAAALEDAGFFRQPGTGRAKEP